MDYKQFCETVTVNIREKYRDRASVQEHLVCKNNGITLHGICIMEEGKCITPTIYLESYYVSYCKGQSMQHILEDICKYHDSQRHIDMPDMTMLDSIEKAKKHFGLRLVAGKNNADYLKELIHHSFLDLEIICALNIKVNGTDSAILVRPDFLAYWEVSEEQFWKIVFETTADPDAVIITAGELLQELTGEELGAYLPDDFDEAPMYILTNRSRYYGAACMVSENVLRWAGGEIGEDYYILPSSVHEVVLLPVSKTQPQVPLQQMVREINEEHVAPDEVLGDTVYYYDRAAQHIMILPEGCCS